MSRLGVLWAGYNRILSARPVLTKACTSFTGFTLGDVLAQSLLEPSGSPYDYARTARLASFGFLVRPLVVRLSDLPYS